VIYVDYTGTVSADSRAWCCSMRASWLTSEMTAAGLTDLQRHSAGHTFFCCCALESAYWFQLCMLWTDATL